MNIKVKKILFWLTWVIPLLTACEKDEIAVYSGADLVNIDYVGMELVKDSIDITYGFVNDQEKTINLMFLLIGYEKNYDREVAITIKSEDGAIAGTHYQIPDKIIIPKNKVKTSVPLIIFRSKDLSENGARSFLLQISKSTDLMPGIQTTLFVRMSDDIPDEWIGDKNWFMNKVSDYFGECSKTKYLFIYKELDIWDFSAWSIWNMMGDNNKFIPAKRILKERLSAYEAQNGPLIDPVKGRVTFPD